MKTPRRQDELPRPLALGSLESEVLAMVCEKGGGSVGEVRARLSRSFAYTTVMTTLDRLYKKGLLDRHKDGRRFFYAPRVFCPADQDDGSNSPRRWQVLKLSAFASYLLDAVGTYDEALLQELEKTIASRRRQFQQGEQR
jgi:predicted transcriptional regulator